MNGFWVIFSNSGGVLNREFAQTEDEAAKVAVKMLQECVYFADGDKIEVHEGWSEMV